MFSNNYACWLGPGTPGFSPVSQGDPGYPPFPPPRPDWAVLAQSSCHHVLGTGTAWTVSCGGLCKRCQMLQMWLAQEGQAELPSLARHSVTQPEVNINYWIGINQFDWLIISYQYRAKKVFISAPLPIINATAASRSLEVRATKPRSIISAIYFGEVGLFRFSPEKCMLHVKCVAFSV